jgi:methylated-DNA-[protein]-cysteine S-methyltransferase
MVDINSWQFSLETRVGWLKVGGNQYFVTSAKFVFDQPPADFGQGAVRDKAHRQLQDYLQGQKTAFDVPLMTRGSEFQQKVWSELESIPAGQTRTYGEIARKIGSSARAIGGACRRNPVAVLVPCHRVVSANGAGGYAGDIRGDNMQVKLWLLDHEV